MSLLSRVVAGGNSELVSMVCKCVLNLDDVCGCGVWCIISVDSYWAYILVNSVCQNLSKCVG